MKTIQAVNRVSYNDAFKGHDATGGKEFLKYRTALPKVSHD